MIYMNESARLPLMILPNSSAEEIKCMFNGDGYSIEPQKCVPRHTVEPDYDLTDENAFDPVPEDCPASEAEFFTIWIDVPTEDGNGALECCGDVGTITDALDAVQSGLAKMRHETGIFPVAADDHEGFAPEHAA